MMRPILPYEINCLSLSRIYRQDEELRQHMSNARFLLLQFSKLSLIVRDPLLQLPLSVFCIIPLKFKAPFFCSLFLNTWDIDKGRFRAFLYCRESRFLNIQGQSRSHWKFLNHFNHDRNLVFIFPKQCGVICQLSRDQSSINQRDAFRGTRSNMVCSQLGYNQEEIWGGMQPCLTPFD